MKFITEMELRDSYRIEPFTTFVLEPHIKITPGARQFLVDRKVKLVQAQGSENKSAKNNTSANNSEAKPVIGRESWSSLRLRAKMDCVESLFYLVGADLLSCDDAVLAEELMELEKCFCNVKNAEREQTVPDPIKFWEWSEEEIKSCANNLEKYFDIDQFHVRLEKRKTIALLNHLRASLCEVEPALLETYWNEEQQACSHEDLIEKVNLIINILSIMIWRYLGGQKCKL
jgi:ethanolamine utilization cobalamin adenosyltransferase